MDEMLKSAWCHYCANMPKNNNKRELSDSEKAEIMNSFYAELASYGIDSRARIS